ncbi:TrmH family RNA methyltransferase [Amycolatopsis cihanbeyliensis]|uniref:SpoU rRNA methylase family protein n=1 Tax=Amycolatopsis cihanbeyliensis TaxID=1128664 RepID=A0A542DRL9_AMYCI|nr:RNA methyltransferase [Amycolatopsis cihanbeyliensis]TQJ05751.1 SpoU rRNA methylase family protein [Amycolatopsis cihanbeyliensis]
MTSHVRHRPADPLEQQRDIVVACAPLRSRVNLSGIVRTAGCCGVPRIIACGNARVDRAIARDAVESVRIENRRTLVPVLRDLRQDGYSVVGLEQTTSSVNIHEYVFPRKVALVVGNERLGLGDEELALTDACVEIPVWGRPNSYNVATATAMALYEYCRQYPHG